MERITTHEMWQGIYELREAFHNETQKGHLLEFYPKGKQGQPLSVSVHLSTGTMNADELVELSKLLLVAAEYAKNYKYNGYHINYGF